MVRVPGALVFGRQFIPSPRTQVEGISSGGATGYKGHEKKLESFIELFVIEPVEASGSYPVAKQELRGHGTSGVAAVEPLRLPPVSALCLLGLSSGSLDRPPSPPPPSLPVCGPTFSPRVSSPALLPLRSQLSLPMSPDATPPSHDWVRRPSPARSVSPIPSVLSMLLRFCVSRAPPPAVFLSPPPSPLAVSSPPFSGFLWAAPFTVSCVLSSLVTDPTAPPPIFALVADFASIRCLEYASKLVYECQRETQ
ncbi:unnamed protein product [Closterium sp. Naga37s-1]|nr:unnamed protein product [Closterium sp. Naga37s-1]